MTRAPHENLAGYVLGELGEDERLAFERELQTDPALAREAGALRALAVRVDAVDQEAFQDLTPPPLRLEESPQPARARTRRSPQLRGTLARLLGAGARQPALAAVLLALVFGGGLGAGLLLSSGSDEDAPPSAFRAEIRLAPVGDLQPAATGDAKLAASGREMRVTVRGLDPNSSDDFYEAWLLNDKQGLVSLGSFRVGADGTATIDVPVPVDPAAFPVVDISLEPADGAPGHSGKSVLRAELT